MPDARIKFRVYLERDFGPEEDKDWDDFPYSLIGICSVVPDPGPPRPGPPEVITDPPAGDLFSPPTTYHMFNHEWADTHFVESGLENALGDDDAKAVRARTEPQLVLEGHLCTSGGSSHWDDDDYEEVFEVDTIHERIAELWCCIECSRVAEICPENAICPCCTGRMLTRWEAIDVENARQKEDEAAIIQHAAESRSREDGEGPGGDT